MYTITPQLAQGSLCVRVSHTTMSQPGRASSNLIKTPEKKMENNLHYSKDTPRRYHQTDTAEYESGSLSVARVALLQDAGPSWSFHSTL